MQKKILVVAVGNPIRQDDAIGPYCIDILKERYRKEKKPVDFMVAHQLDILHCQLFAEYSLVILVDAEGRPLDTPYALELIDPKPSTHSFNSHIGSIGDILSLTEKLYGLIPMTYLVAIKGAAFEVGEGLSSEALKNAKAALEAIENLINEFLPSH